MDDEEVQAKQPYEAPIVDELGSFNTETEFDRWGNSVEVGNQKLYYGSI